MATETTTADKKKGLFWGIWIIVAVSIAFSFSSVMTYLAVIIWPSMMKLNGFAPGDLGLVAAILMWGSIGWSPLVGFLTDKWGPKKTMLLAVVIYLIIGVIVPTITEYWQVIVYFSIPAGFSQAVLGGVTSNTLLRRFYMKNAGTAVSVMYVCSALLQMVAYPNLVRLSMEMTFRPVVLWSVATMMVIAFILVWLLVKDTPEAIGQNIDGMSDEEKNKFMAGFGGQIMAEKHNTVAEAMKMPQFWLWTVCMGLIPGVLLGVMQNLTTIGMTYGYEAATVGIIMTYFMVTSLIGRLAAGPIADRIGKRVLLLICLTITAITMFAGYIFLKDVTGINIFVAVFGLFIMPNVIVMAPLLGDLFGRLNMGKIFGVTGIFSTAITGACPLIAGLIKSMTGNYNLWLLVSGILLMVGLVCIIFMRPTATEINNLGFAKKQKESEAKA